MTMTVESKKSFLISSEKISTKFARIDLKIVGVLVCFYSITKIIDTFLTGRKRRVPWIFDSKIDHIFLCVSAKGGKHELGTSMNVS